MKKIPAVLWAAYTTLGNDAAVYVHSAAFWFQTGAAARGFPAGE